MSKIVRNVVKPVVKRILLAWERMESGVSYDLTSSAFIEDPYRTYEQLRRKDPVHRMRLIEAWALTRYEDVQDVLIDHKRFTNAKRNYDYMQYRTFLDLDPPDHTRLRGLVSKAFTPRAVRELGPRIQGLVYELLDAVAGKDRIDLISDFAFPLPVIVIAEMLGVPAQDRARFREWSDDIALSVNPLLNSEQIERVQQATEELFDYFEGIIEQRRQAPQNDMISALLAAEEEGDRLTHEELLSTLMLLLVAGNETTRNLIGNGMLALLKSPAQLQRLRDHPELLDSAINELLRYDSPVQIDSRNAIGDVEIGGKRIAAGQRILAIVGAANRDPQIFANPDELDIGRDEVSHLSFGRGIHYCLGSPLAILEGRVAFTSLLERFSSIRLASDPMFKEQIVLRGVEELWVEVEH